MKKVSVICPVYNEEKHIKDCIETLLGQDYPDDFLEFIFVDGCSTDRTVDILHDIIKNNSSISLISNPDRYVSYALNLGIKSSTGDIIIRVDAHSKYPSNYISKLVKNLIELGADNVGGIWRTMPASNSLKHKAIAFCSSSPFGVGFSLHKIGVNRVEEIDTVPYGCFPKEIFTKIGYFDIDLIRNQDDEFNARILKSGGKIFILPDLIIDYYARSSLKKMAKMYFEYGLYKPLVSYKIGALTTWRQLVPFAFFIYLLLFIPIIFHMKMILGLYSIGILLYILINGVFSLRAGLKESSALLILISMLVFFIIHISYGAGYFLGLFKLLKYSISST